ncbi:MAG: hypothetical protein U0V70_05400 [Terriglobia bacterium]
MSEVPSKFFLPIGLVFLLIATLGPNLLGQVIRGAYPVFPPSGVLQGKTVEQQVRFLKSMGVTLVGGRFQDGTLPKQLRAAGMKTLGMIVLWEGEEHWKSHPESQPVMSDGSPLPQFQDYAGVCPNQEWLQKLKLEEIKTLLQHGYYDVIALDFLQYPVQWKSSNPELPDTCYCRVCLGKFQKQTGIQIPRELKQVADQAAWIRQNQASRWIRWRADQITAFCDKVSQLRDRTRPTTLIALSAIPWQSTEYNNAIYQVAGQDLKRLSKFVEVFAPMSYFQSLDRPVQWIAEVNAYFAHETGRQIWPRILMDSGNPLSRNGWKQVYELSSSRGADGFIITPFPSATGSEAYTVFLEMFGNR